MTYKTKIPVHPLKLPLKQFVERACETGKKYLLIGDETKPLSDLLDSLGWKGQRIVTRPPDYSVPENQKLVVAHIGPDAHLRPVLSGHWARMVTMEEIFNQFPGPYDLIAMIRTGRDRELWQTPTVFNALPKIYILGEDGHNEGVIDLGFDRGYTPHLADGYLVMVHR